jgi:hypothetical protein
MSIKHLIRTMGLALVAALAMSTALASAAQAAEGPFYKVGGGRLTATNEFSTTISPGTTFILSTPSIGVTITCTEIKAKAGATLVGSTGANAGKSKETLVYSGCTVSGNGAGCSVANGGVIETVPLTNTLAYGTSTRSGKILIYFAPESGPTFVTIKFTGTCNTSETSVTGTAIGEARSAGTSVLVGSEPAEAGEGEVNFPAMTILKAWVESSGALKEVKGKLIAFLFESRLEGTSVIKLALGGNWGVYTV